ncbi:MAG TPA: hypothetical protein VK249_07210 [Anaerolineales bacterium]|nr:hypothetical protein [Anaerolineales bacterium]
MNTTAAKQILTQKEPANLYEVVQPSLETVGIRDLLVEGSFAKEETYRYNSVRVLYRALERRPELFYHYWPRFEPMLDSPNGFHRSIAAQAIALLSPVDKDCRLDAIFDHYLGLLDDPKVMVTHYFISTLGRIYRARPDFRKKVLNSLLGIDETSHRPGQRDLLKADIMAVFQEVSEMLPAQDKLRVLKFVEAQLESSSPKTRKAAKEFLKKHL